MSVSIQKRIQQLKKAKADLEKELADAAEQATLRAIQKTTEATPPKAGTGRMAGTETLKSHLKERWAMDSNSKPIIENGKYITSLDNNKQYASYVENGHRMDRHFVPGLVVNEFSGLLEMDPDGDGGIMVGTRTFWVNGEFMTDKGKEEYQKALEEILDGKLKELLE